MKYGEIPEVDIENKIDVNQTNIKESVVNQNNINVVMQQPRISYRAAEGALVE